jgi:hypothetical protein
MIEDRDWEKIGYGTNRLKVPGGWFVMLYTGGPAKTAFFYPDPNHGWDGSALRDDEAAPEVNSLSAELAEKLVAAAAPAEPVETAKSAQP